MMDKNRNNNMDAKLINLETNQDYEINMYDLCKIVVKRKVLITSTFLICLLIAILYCFILSPIYRLEAYAKLYMPKDITTVKELPTAKDLSALIGRIDRDNKNREKKDTIFSKTKDEITEARIDEIKGSTDKFKITIESLNLDNLPTSLQELIVYIENIHEIKDAYKQIISEIDEKIVNVNNAVIKNDSYIKEIEKRLSSPKLLPVGFNPVEINNKTVDLKMEKYRLEHERKNYKPVRLLQDPFISKYPVKPNTAMTITIAGICSLMLGIVMAFIAEYFDVMKSRTNT